jgi:hypothetical protein
MKKRSANPTSAAGNSSTPEHLRTCALRRPAGRGTAPQQRSRPVDQQQRRLAYGRLVAAVRPLSAAAQPPGFSLTGLH